MDIRRIERLLRSTALGIPFPTTNALTKYEYEGREHLEAALERRRRSGRGLITISNHQSLFDDPLVLTEMLNLRFLTVESKTWWSTPCQHNFAPSGARPKDRLVRYFSDVSNMVFFERPGKNGDGVRRFDEYADTMARRVDEASFSRFEDAAATAGVDVESWFQRFVTPGDKDRLVALNQIGMVEACARIATGEWVHFFPEGTRSRNLAFRDPKKGVGKVIYQSAGADVLPICFYGMHDVLPINSMVPRPFHRVVVTIGEPLPAASFDDLRAQTPTPQLFQEVVERAWGSVKAMRPYTLAKHLGPAKAAELLKAEAPAAAMPTGELVGQPAAWGESLADQPARPMVKPN